MLSRNRRSATIGCGWSRISTTGELRAARSRAVRMRPRDVSVTSTAIGTASGAFFARFLGAGFFVAFFFGAAFVFFGAAFFLAAGFFFGLGALFFFGAGFLRAIGDARNV